MPDPTQARERYKRPYAESSIFIAWIENETSADGASRGAISTHFLQRAQQGDYTVTTSAWTLAEVHKKRHGPKLTTDQDEKILAWFEHPFIELVDVDREIGEHANKLAREHNLMPGDAVHVACALRAKCDCLLSWDSDLADRDDLPIATERPQRLGQSIMGWGEGGGA